MKPDFSGSAVDRALAYAARGWPVIPLHSVANGRCSCQRRAACTSKGKHPLTHHGLRDATTDESTIREWFGAHPTANVGIVTGPKSGIFALDVDAKTGGPATLAKLIAEHGELPATLIQDTGGGGAHFFFRYPTDGEIKSRTNLAPGLDVRGDGGYVVVAPSIHESGRNYEFRSDPSGAEIAAAPAWLIDLCRSGHRTADSRSTTALTQPATDVARLRDALRHVDANDRDIWLRVGAALKHDLGDPGRAVWDEWSAGSKKFDAAGQDRTWASLGDHPAPVTLGTVFHMARRNGWSGAPAASTSGTNGTLSRAAWPSLRPLPRLAIVDEFDPALLPSAFRPWVLDIAERMQCPIDFVAVGAIVVAAGTLGRKVGIRPKARDNWVEVPNLWGAIVGRPGVLKTPALREIMRPLVELERAEKENFAALQQTFDAASVIQKAQTKKDEAELKQHLDDEKLIKEIARRIVDKKDAPKRRRFIVHDTTVEKLGEILAENENGVLLFRDELTGFFDSLDRPGQECARAFYLECWDGKGRFTYDRIGRGTIEIECATLSILGNLQPGPLTSYLAQAAQGGRSDDGLLQRFQLLVFPDVPREWRNIDRPPNEDAQLQAFRAFGRLAHLKAEHLGAEKTHHAGISALRFSADAQPIFDAWRAALEQLLRSGSLPPSLESHLAKFRGLVPSIALLIHVIDEGRGPVGVVALQQAIGWARYLESHARRVYGMHSCGELSTLNQLGDALIGGVFADGFTARDVYRTHRSGLSDPKAVAFALQQLVDLGWLRERRKQTGGRPLGTYEINPDIERLRAETSAVGAESPSTVPPQAPGAPGDEVPKEPEVDVASVAPARDGSVTSGTLWRQDERPQSLDSEMGIG